MEWKNTTTGYGWPAIFLHWLMLILIVGVYAAMDFKSLSPRGSALRASMASWHYMLGLSVFTLAWLRLLVRATGTAPRIEPPVAPWDARLAGAAHFALYAMMVGMPVLGWLTLSAKGEAIPFFGFALPALTAKNENLAQAFKQVHESLATVGYFLIALHVLAGLWHHYVKRDNTLLLMWPRR
jgi:cytochrome b561